jgi:hypothetical protein
VHVLGHAELAACVPAGPIQDEHERLVRAGVDWAGERLQRDREERATDGRWQMGQLKDGAPGGGRHQADQGAPCNAVLHGRPWPLALATPDLVPDRLQPNAVLVDRPERDLGAREGGGDRLDERPPVFF